MKFFTVVLRDDTGEIEAKAFGENFQRLYDLFQVSFMSRITFISDFHSSFSFKLCLLLTATLYTVLTGRQRICHQESNIEDKPLRNE